MGQLAAYIDGFNLYYGMKSKYGRRDLWLDVVELVRRLRPQDDLVKVRYFSAIVKNEPVAAQNQYDYIQAVQLVVPSQRLFLVLPPGNASPSRHLTSVANLSCFFIRGSALRNAQLPGVVYDAATGRTLQRPAKWR